MMNAGIIPRLFFDFIFMSDILSAMNPELRLLAAEPIS
jgi:hypothetical protein